MVTCHNTKKKRSKSASIEKTTLRGFFYGPTNPSESGNPHCRVFTITLRHTIIGSIPLDEWSAQLRNLYLTTHNTHKSQTSMAPAGIEPAIPAREWPQTHTLDRAATDNDTWTTQTANCLLRGLFIALSWCCEVTPSAQFAKLQSLQRVWVHCLLCTPSWCRAEKVCSAEVASFPSRGSKGRMYIGLMPS